MGTSQIKLVVHSPNVPDESPRDVIDCALQTLGEPAERVSLAVGLPRNYLRLYLQNRLPRILPVHVRRRLADYLGVPETALR
ncbi:MAG TPA: hypothetical protein VEU47_17765 [Candidatus Cybelea sp.]|nr:hypothetical protein [Candidatus Cybelea sp.]